MSVFFKKWYLTAAIGVFVGLLAASGSAIAASVQWKMVTPWSGGPWLERDVKRFVDYVNVLTEGRVKITPYPSGTLYSPLKVTEAVQKGIAETGNNWMGYDWGLSRTTVLFAGYAGGFTPEGYILWLYTGGGLKLWEQYRKEKFGVISFPCSTLSTDIFLHSKKKVETINDLKGLKVRTAGCWAEILSRLGASTVTLPGAEVYSALERGIIDAVEWGSPEINLPTGFHKIAKYIITPGIQNPGGFLECEVNEKAWNKLSKHDQEMLKLAGQLNVYESWQNGVAADLVAFQTFEKGPNVIIHLNKEFIDTALKETHKWADEQAAKDPWFKKVLDSQRAYKNKLKSWHKFRLLIGGYGN